MASFAVVACCLALPAASHAASPPGNFRPFAPDSIWNLPLRADAPIDPQSNGYVGWLQGQIATSGSWINTTQCGQPTYWADANTPTTTVTLASTSYPDKALIRAWSAVPIPAGATPSKCSDANLAVIQTQPDGSLKEWELWRAVQNADGTWKANWGGVTQDIRKDRGIASKFQWTDPTALLPAERASSQNWNVTASSISMIAGVITATDVARGRIDHALALATPDAAQTKLAWPAQRTDGASTDPNALPLGSRLRIDPNLDLTTITMTPLVRMMAVAAQKYGIVLRDRTWTTTVFYTSEVRPGEPNPYKTANNGMYADAALKAFPWSSLRVLAAPTCTAPPGCAATERADISLSDAPTAGSPVTVDTSNSWLDHPRTDVRWDLDGDGSYERHSGAAVSAVFTPALAGPLNVGVQITTRGGSILTARRTIDVQAPSA